MNNVSRLDISYEAMEMMIQQYFAQQGRKVKVTISSSIDTDRFAGTVTTLISIAEEVEIAGVKSTSKRYLTRDELNEILGELLDRENKELVGITYNAYATNSIEGEYMSEHVTSKIEGKSFSVAFKPKEPNLSHR